MPLSDTVCGLPVALSVTAIVPVRVPVVLGVKVTAMVQLDPAFRLLPQLLLWLKSPLGTMLLIVSLALPELVSVTFCGLLLVPTS